MTQPFLVYHDPAQPPARVTTARELDEVLLRVTARALDEEAPLFAVIITPDGRRRLDIGLGESEYSVLVYHDGIAEQPASGQAGDGGGATGKVFASKGLPVPYDAGFDYDGVWSPAPVNAAISIADARDAAREFLSTGGDLPSGVQWQEPQYET